MLAKILAWPLSVRLAIGLWAVLIIAVSVRVAISKPSSGSVMPIYLKAAENWLASENLYVPVDGMDIYRYPPGYAALTVPFLGLPEKLAGILWRLLNVTVFLVGLHQARRALFPNWSRSRTGWLFGLSLWLALPAFNNAQVNLLLGGVLLLTLAELVRERFGWATLWIAVGMGLKVYPVATGLLALLIWPRQLGWRWGLAISALAGLPFLLQKPGYVAEQYANFWHHLQNDERTYDALIRTPRNWVIIPRVWFELFIPPLTSRLVSLAFAGLLACWVLLHRKSWTISHTLNLVVLAIVWMTTFGPATEANTYSIAAGVVVLKLLECFNWWSVLGYGLLVSVVVRGLWPNDWTWQVLGPQPLGMLGFAVASLGTVASGGPGSKVLGLKWRSHNRLPVELPIATKSVT